jgi:APA family basic amino acid/polyamine antiporter
MARPGAPRARLLRILGLTFGLAVTIGGTVGVSILRAPSSVAALFPSSSSPLLLLAAWLLGGIFVLVSAFSIVELATTLPRAGGFYVYTREAFGDAVGFTAGWVDWLTQCSALAYLGVSIAEFSAALHPPLLPFTSWLCAALILALAAIHWRGVRAGARAQQLTAFLQACAFLLFIAACFFLPVSPHPPSVPASTLPPAALFFPFILALRLTVAAFDGWYSAIFFSEELRDPHRSLPRSILGGTLVIAAVYLLFNAALLRVLPNSVLSSSPLPPAAASAVLFGPRGAALATLLCLLSLPPAFNSSLLCATRIAFAMSRDGLFLPAASAVSPRGAPTLAMALSALAGIVLSLSGTFAQLLAWVGILNAATYCAALAALIALRRRSPAAPRPFSVPLYPWLTLLALAGGAALLLGAVHADPRGTLQALALIAAGYPLYLLARARSLPR